MAGYYSMIVLAHQVLTFPEQHLALGVGTNIFTVWLKDQEVFCEELRQQGCEIVEVNRLDEPENLDDLDVTPLP